MDEARLVTRRLPRNARSTRSHTEKADDLRQSFEWSIGRTSAFSEVAPGRCCASRTDETDWTRSTRNARSGSAWERRLHAQRAEIFFQQPLGTLLEASRAAVPKNS